MKNKKWRISLIVGGSILLMLAILAYGVYWAFFDIQRIDGQAVLAVSQSPDSAYTVTAYLNNGGATTDFAVLCSVKNNESGRERNIYWNYHCTTADIHWLSNTTVSINGIELDVTKDTFDYRRE